jgi:anti-sigma B factor antagonist
MAIRYELRQHEPDITVVSMTGQLNLGNRLAEFEYTVKQRIAEGTRKIILDLTGLTYIDSAGLGMVAACAGIIFKEGGKLVVVSPGAKITQMFEITRLNRVIDIYTDFDAACAVFSPPAAASSEPS